MRLSPGPTLPRTFFRGTIAGAALALLSLAGPAGAQGYGSAARISRSVMSDSWPTR